MLLCVRERVQVFLFVLACTPRQFHANFVQETGITHAITTTKSGAPEVIDRSMMTGDNVPSLVIILETALQIPVSVNRDTVNAAVQESVVRKPRIRGHLSLSLSPLSVPKSHSLLRLHNLQACSLLFSFPSFLSRCEDAWTWNRMCMYT